jgi:hypothetical protein
MPATHLLSLIAKTWRGAYFSHKESEQWKKFEIRATFKIAIFLGLGCSSHNIIIHKVWRTLDQGMIFNIGDTAVMLYLM